MGKIDVQAPADMALCEHCEFWVKGDMQEHVAQFCPVARERRRNETRLESFVGNISAKAAGK